MKKHLLSCAILLACSPVFAAGNTDSIEARLAALEKRLQDAETRAQKAESRATATEPAGAATALPPRRHNLLCHRPYPYHRKRKRTIVVLSFTAMPARVC